jgi:hypothetical protein
MTSSLKITRQPFVDGGDLGSKSLQLVDGQRPNLKQRPGEKVLDTLLGGSQLLSHHSITGSVLQRTLGKKLEQRTPRTSYGSTEGRHNLFRLLHCRSRCYLMRGIGIHREIVSLNESGEHRLRSTSSHDEVELLDQANLDRPFLVMATMITIGWNVDRSINEVIPAEDLLGPELEREQR